MIAQILVEAAQDLLAAIDEDRLDAETVEDAGEFDGDIAAADDADALRQALEMEGLVRGDGEFAPGRWRGTKGAAPVAMSTYLARDAAAVGKRDGVAILEGGARHDEFGARPLRGCGYRPC